MKDVFAVTMTQLVFLGKFKCVTGILNKLEPNTTGSSQKRIHQNWIIEHKYQNLIG